MDDAIEVTPEMVEAGAKVLAEDGLMSEFCAEGIVADVFKAMWAARQIVNPPPGSGSDQTDPLPSPESVLMEGATWGSVAGWIGSAAFSC